VVAKVLTSTLSVIFVSEQQSLAKMLSHISNEDFVGLTALAKLQKN
jgi:hypothetical protein